MKKTLFLFSVILIYNSVAAQTSRNYRKARYHSYHHHHYYNYHHRSNSNNFDGDLYQDDWIVYGSASQYVNNSLGVKNAYGISAEYLFADNWSIRGGIYANPDFYHITPAPLGILFLKLEANYGVSSHGDDGKAIIGAIISLAMNDGIGYNIPIGNRIHLMPYFGTWQPEFQYNGPDTPAKVKDLCSMGLNLKYQFAGNWLLSADAEYDRTVWFKNSDWSYRLTFSLGFKID